MNVFDWLININKSNNVLTLVSVKLIEFELIIRYLSGLII